VDEYLGRGRPSRSQFNIARPLTAEKLHRTVAKAYRGRRSAKVVNKPPTKQMESRSIEFVADRWKVAACTTEKTGLKRAKYNRTHGLRNSEDGREWSDGRTCSLRCRGTAVALIHFDLTWQGRTSSSRSRQAWQRVVHAGEPEVF
jgi:hypothetical protein